MKNQSTFLKKISKNGLYIILFLCIAAVGVAGYVMYQTQEKPDTSGLVHNFMQQDDGYDLSPVFDDSKTVEIPNPEPKTEPVTTPAKPEVTQPEKTEKTEAAPQPKAAAASSTATIDDGPTEFVSAVSGKIEVPFSGDELVKSKTFGDWRTHAGIDIAAEEGTKVCAIAKGVVKEVFEDEMMGHTVVIEHADGIVSTYCNLMKGVVAKVGQTVKAGDVIGGIGSSAIAESMELPHLHLEVTKNGEAIDPMSLIEEK